MLLRVHLPPSSWLPELTLLITGVPLKLAPCFVFEECNWFWITAYQWHILQWWKVLKNVKKGMCLSEWDWVILSKCQFLQLGAQNETMLEPQSKGWILFGYHINSWETEVIFHSREIEAVLEKCKVIISRLEGGCSYFICFNLSGLCAERMHLIKTKFSYWGVIVWFSV